MNGDKFDEAINAYTAAIALDGGNHALFSNRSAAYTASGKCNAALKDAEKAIVLNPIWYKGYLRKGDALHSMEKYRDAVLSYKKGLSSVEVFLNFKWFQLKFFSNLGMEYDPDNKFLSSRLARTLHTEFLGLHTTNMGSEEWTTHGRIHLMFEDPSKAVAAFSNALKLDPNNAIAMQGCRKAIVEEHLIEEMLAFKPDCVSDIGSTDFGKFVSEYLTDKEQAAKMTHLDLD